MICCSYGEFEKTKVYKMYVLHVTTLVYNLDKVFFHFCSYRKIYPGKMVDFNCIDMPNYFKAINC